jgi:hypothetical protein
MRKKLLALLMCATMVLGSSAVAFASPSSDDYTNATTVLKNGEKIVKEYEDSTIKTTVYVPGVGGANYAFATSASSDGTYKAYKLNADDKALLYIGTPVDLTSYETITNFDGTTGTTVGAAVNLSQVLTDYLANNGKSYNATSAISPTSKTTDCLEALGLSRVIVNYKDATTGITSAILLENSKPTTNSIAKNGDWSVVTALTSGTVGGKTAYYTSDGYSFVVDDSAPTSFFKGIKATGADGTTYAYTLSAIKSDSSKDYSDIQLSVAEALSDGTLSADAAAVRVKLYQYGTVANQPVLTEVTAPSTVVSLPLNNDLLSRTKLKASTVDAYFVSNTLAADTNIGTYRTIGSLTTSLDATEAYKTFNLPVGYTTNAGFVVIFDKSADESQNDGVSDTDTTATTTAASQTAATSPKTGDVAPIAALAVVMMGACGAMVVASKKRA